MSRVLQQNERAGRSLAGGVSSSTRRNSALGHALYFERARGCRVWDLDGREYLDLCCSHGATLLGHGDSRVQDAVRTELEKGAPCSYESELHSEFAELLCETVPCLERVRFTGSGTEATMHALRLARSFSGRQKILRFEGNFHGFHDQVMWTTAGPLDQFAPPLKPVSAGVTAGSDQYLVQLPYNRVDLLEAAFSRHADELGAAIIEPIYYNAGCVIPTPEFLQTLRRLTRQHGVVLIFDEVLSAFRMGPGGAQEYLGVTPDLCTLGKAVGGSFPLSVFGGRQEIMDRLMPIGDCQHSGTYNGHPVMVAAGLAALRAYREPGFYPHIHQIADQLYGGLQKLFHEQQVPARVQGLGARFGVYFGLSREVQNFAAAMQHHREKFLKFVALAIEHGVYFHDYGGGPCHHGFCGAMTPADVNEVLERLTPAVAKLAAEG